MEPRAAQDPASTARDEPSEVPVRSIRSTLRAVLLVVGPTALVTGLLYYFGWTRTNAQAQELGLDESLFGYSSSDYILRSVSSMYWPLFIGATAVLVGLMIHGIVEAMYHDPGPSTRSRARRLAAVVGVLGALLLALGVGGARVQRPSRFVSLFAPIGVTLGIVLLAYAAHLFITYGQGLGTGRYAKETKDLVPYAWGLLTILVLLSLFWSVSHYAAIRGIDLAAELERRLPSRPKVVIYSAKRLYLEPSITETRLDDPDAAYRYRYSGLRLLARSQQRYFLRPSDLTDRRNIIIAEQPDVRFEFSRSSGR
jgi:hypothetical protein